MALEGTRQGKLTQFVADHVLGHESRHMLAAVMPRNRQADKIGQYGGTARPGLDRTLVVGAASGLNSLQQMPVDEGAFFN